MKTIIALALVVLTISNPLFSKKYVDYLKKVAPYEVYEPEENPFKDWTLEEIRAMLSAQIPNVEAPPEEKVDPNDSYDFRQEHPECMLEIRDQMNCGSCWAFSGTSTLQERFCLQTQGRTNVLLSPQDPVSCDKGNMGCNGGYLQYTWEYYKNTGVVEDSCFPYTAGEGYVERCVKRCKNGAVWKKYKVSNYGLYAGFSAIKRELVANGPIQTGFNVYADFMSYKSGIYVQRSRDLQGGHAVIIVGYGTEDGVNYWICQNSWGPLWGEQGYFRIKMGQCGIDSETYAGVPFV